MKPTTTPDTKMRLESSDIVDERINSLRETFPEVFAEGKIDFDKLRLALGAEVDTGRERYGLTWAGKADAMRAVQTPSMATLVPVREESVDWDTAQNVFIEGENLEALKLLQKGYCGKIAAIYIDPPYNTGNEFIYPDNYRDSIGKYLSLTGQISADGQKLSTNAETSGRYHSNWLNMMYPRLFLARNLLQQDGLIFVSVDDHEVENLRCLLDEIFGEENFVASLVWKKSYGGGSKAKYVVGLHEYVIVYARQIASLKPIELPPDPNVLKYYKHRDSKAEVRGPFRTQPLATKSMDDRPNLRFPIRWKNEDIWPEKQWQWSRERVEIALANDELVIAKKNGKWVVDYKQYLRDEAGQERGSKPFSVLDGPYTQIGTEELRSLGLGSSGFNFPKPVGLVEELIQYCPDDSLVLDFFAGSGTTAHAAMKLNAKDRGTRRFILVQFPEPVENPHFPSIAAITRERVRRAARAITDSIETQLSFAGASVAPVGLRSFRLTDSNFKMWDADLRHESEDAMATQLRLHTDHVRPDRSQEDILFEILLKAGYPLTAHVEQTALELQVAFEVSEGDLIICLESPILIETLRAAIAREPKPVQIICLDHAFEGNDQLKTNIVLEMEAQNIAFHTV